MYYLLHFFYFMSKYFALVVCLNLCLGKERPKPEPGNSWLGAGSAAAFHQRAQSGAAPWPQRTLPGLSPEGFLADTVVP